MHIAVAPAGGPVRISGGAEFVVPVGLAVLAGALALPLPFDNDGDESYEGADAWLGAGAGTE